MGLARLSYRLNHDHYICCPCNHIRAQVYRHGDRTPIVTWPTDPYASPSLWPQGFGQLTIVSDITETIITQLCSITPIAARDATALLPRTFVPRAVHQHDLSWLPLRELHESAGEDVLVYYSPTLAFWRFFART